MLLSSQTRLGLRMTGKEIYVKIQVHVLTVNFLILSTFFCRPCALPLLSSGGEKEKIGATQ